jgi:ribosomal protein S18 acetylase RimI-like enzyme
MVETIRAATPADIDTIKQIAIDTNMFGPEDVGFFDEMITGFVDGTMKDDYWLVVDDDDTVVAGAYYAPEPFSDRMWNLYFISVSPHHQGRGIGGKLLGHVEAKLRDGGSDSARVIIVETSSTDRYARTRDFYRQHNYDEEARIREFYGPNDHKVVFWKSLIS